MTRRPRPTRGRAWRGSSPRAALTTAGAGVVFRPIAGYSDTPQARKLGIKPGLRVALDQPPDGWALLDPPADIVHVDQAEAADVIICFFTAAEQLPARLPALAERIYPSGGLWIAWPRRAGGHESDITDSIIRAHALALGIVDIKVAAIDDDWSGQRYMWRKELRSRRD